MNQRVLAAVLAMPLVVALVVIALTEPLPYTTYGPGPTIDVLSAPGGEEIIQVSGQKTYRDDGSIRMTTVSVSPKDADLNLFQVMTNWLDRSDAVYPHDKVYQPGQSEEDVRNESAVEMVSSQDTAIAVALVALGHDVTPALEVQLIAKGSPADGALAVRDVFVAVNGEEIAASDDIEAAAEQLRGAIAATPPGEQVEFTVLRDGEETTLKVTPELVEGRQQVGITLGQGFIFPFTVTVNIDQRIGGPSAGLMFSLAIYDTLTPGSLTGGGSVAGTGEIDAEGRVGPIGGIQQKIVGARSGGADLFLVPSDNCPDAEGARNGDMELVRVTTMESALSSIEAWAEDHDADLPTCEGS